MPTAIFCKKSSAQNPLGEGESNEEIRQAQNSPKRREEQLRAFDSLSLTVNPRAIKYSLILRLLTKEQVFSVQPFLFLHAENKWLKKTEAG